MSAIVEAARRYIGVPFVHQGRSSRGLDCVGLLWLAYADCGVHLDPHRSYPGEPDTAELVLRITASLGNPVVVSPVRSSDLQLGDVVLLVLPREKNPHHVGLVANYPLGGFSLIHAHSMAKPRGRVIEHRLANDHVSRITHVFRRPV